MALRFDPALTLGEAHERMERLRAAITAEVRDAELSIVPVGGQ